MLVSAIVVQWLLVPHFQFGNTLGVAPLELLTSEGFLEGFE